jgi:hypothetical protein
VPVRNVFLVLLLAGVAGTASAAATWRWVDADGVHFSDQPHPGTEKVTLAQPQTYPSGPPPAGSQPGPRAPSVPAAQRGPFRYDSCKIVQPANDEVLLDPEMVMLRAQVSPSVRQSDQVTLSLDGLAIQGQGQLEARIQPAERGTHTAAVTIRDAAGKTLCQSADVTFHVRQASQLAPLNPNNPNRKH